LSHQNIRKICSIATILLVILAATSLSLAVTPQGPYECKEWKFKIVDDWWNWGASAAKYDPVTGSFGAVAYLYNSTPPPTWSGTWSFENWELRGQGVADPDGWVTICVPRSWDRTPSDSGKEINYTLIVKLMIGGEVTPITIYNGTILRIGEYDGDAEFIGLETLLNASTIEGSYPGKSWIVSTPNKANGTATLNGKLYAVFKMWLYYVAMQPLDELGFPITGATLEVRYNSSYKDHPVNSDPGTYITNVREKGWSNKLYGKWVTNGSLGQEFVQDPFYVYHANYHVGWVVLRVPLVNETTATDSTFKSSLVSNMTFIWRYKSGTPINVTYYYWSEPGRDEPGAFRDAWDPSYLDTAPPAVGSYATYTGALRVNTTHLVEAMVRWTQVSLLDCNRNPWWTMKAEVYAFDTADKNQYMLAATRVGPGQYLLRYPLPVEPFPETTLTLAVEWYYSVVNVSSRYRVHADGTTILVDDLQPNNNVYDNLWWGNNLWWGRAAPGVGFAYIDTGKNIMVVNKMAWVDVNFWSSAELPQQPADFSAKIWLPATIGYRKAEPITVWWNGRNGFVVLPDMEWYSGPNPTTVTEMDPWHFADSFGYYYGGDEGYEFYFFWYAMKNYFGGFTVGDGNGWLPTREVGWVDFEAWYEGVQVLDTYAEKQTPDIYCCPGYPIHEEYDPELEEWYTVLGHTQCHFNLTLKIYELGFHIILEACGNQMDAPDYVPFFFKHPGLSALDPRQPLVGPKSVTNGKVDIVKAPKGEYSDFAIVWHMSLLRPYKILYRLDNGTDIPLTEPIELTENMRNIQLYFKLWNLTIDTWSQDPFRLINVNVTLFSVSNFQIAPGVGISRRQLDQITDPNNWAYSHVLPEGWAIYHRATTEDGFPVIYYCTDTQTNKWDEHPHWEYLPEKNYWIWVRVPGWNSMNTTDTSDDVWDPQKAVNAGFRMVDANATLYWSGDPGVGPLYLDKCYGKDSPLIVYTYVYNPRMALKTACGEPLVFGETDNSALILAEPWYSDAEPNNLFYRQQIDPYNLINIGTPTGVKHAPYNAYLVRKNATDSNGVITLSSVNASSVSPPNDPDLWNPKTGWRAEVYPNQSRYLIGRSVGGPIKDTFPEFSPIRSSSPEYRFMVYYKGVLVFNESIVLNNPYVDKVNPIKTSVYPYVFRATNDPLKGGTVFGIANINVTVFWAGLNVTWWPTKHLTYDTAPIEFSLLNASKLAKGFNMSVVKRLWGPAQLVTRYLENIPYQPVPPYFSSMVVVESKLTNAEGKATFLIPVWNYSVTPGIYTYVEGDDGAIGGTYLGGPRNPWNKALGPLSINLIRAGTYHNRTGALFGTPVYANFTTVPGVTNNIPAGDVPRLVGVLKASSYARWIQYAMNATGLVNPATDTWRNTRSEIKYPNGDVVYRDGVSLNTTYRARYKAQPWAGVGMLSGGAYQHRAPDSETGTTVSQGQDGCYAKAEERVIANDIGVVVRNLDKVGLPNQKVTITREAIYVGTTKVADKAVLLEDWTPTKPNADPTDYYALYLRSTPSNILWGLYDVTIKTENLTRGMSNTLLKLNDPQFLAVRLKGGAVDWRSGIYYLDWPARLRVTILTEDGRPIEKAWVYVVDGYTRGNVTAAITDEYGHAGTLRVALGDAVPPLRIEPGDRVDIGFNLLRGWYWLDKDKMLNGTAVNPDWNIDTYNIPPQPVGDEYIQNITYVHDEDDGVRETGWARFYGRYYIVVYYKPAGCSVVQGPVISEVVFDSYTDEPQHQYIYLGIWPETPYGGTASFSASQAFDRRAYVNDLRISFQDSVGRPLTRVTGKAKHPKYGWEDVLTFNSGDSNTVTLTMVPLRPGTSYSIHAEWTSRYGTKAVVDSSVKDLYSVVTMPVFDVTLRLVTPRGAPLVGVGVKVGGADVGATSATGEVMVTQIPSGTYNIAAKWLDTDLTVPSLVVTTNGAVTLTPSNVHLLTVVVRGAQGQALEGATVRVKKGTVELTKLTDKDGKAEIELPDASYNIEVSYGQFTKTDTVTMTADTIKAISLDVFVEFLGVAMSMAQFLLFIVMIIIIVIVLAIVLHEYHIYRRKRLPQLFGAPAAPK